jgi:predicted nuclease with TOPRIM domain
MVGYGHGARYSNHRLRVPRVIPIYAILRRVDIGATMQFIVEHQAKLTASQEKHDEAIAELRKLGAGHEERIARLETSVATVTDLVGRLPQAEIRLVERMERVDDRQERLFERMDRFIQGLEGNGHKTA